LDKIIHISYRYIRKHFSFLFFFVGFTIFISFMNLLFIVFFLSLYFQISSKTFCPNRKKNFMQCLSEHMAQFMNKMHTYFPIYLRNWSSIMHVVKLIWPRQWIHFSIRCIRKCLRYWIHSTRSMISEYFMIIWMV
jgi:hypothetical protein